jgi:RNA polymerase sigma-70 factor (ECF subfamily)
MIDWGSILADHGSTVWRTVYRLLDHHADALDCYQETFLAALQIAEPQAVADWSSLLTCLATRRAMDRLRQRYRLRKQLIPIATVAEPSSAADDPFLQTGANELMDLVRRGLADLPEKQADVFWLSCIEGFTYPQIADRLQVAQGEVRVLLHRARKRLSVILNLNRLNETGTP